MSERRRQSWEIFAIHGQNFGFVILDRKDNLDDARRSLQGAVANDTVLTVEDIDGAHWVVNGKNVSFAKIKDLPNESDAEQR